MHRVASAFEVCVYIGVCEMSSGKLHPFVVYLGPRMNQLNSSGYFQVKITDVTKGVSQDKTPLQTVIIQRSPSGVSQDKTPLQTVIIQRSPSGGTSETRIKAPDVKRICTAQLCAECGTIVVVNVI
ncbi:hypothetical protein F2P81_024251 [Scophthalmus maximus]|uniref:Uncharacterized protein n=1 Tax=Scophthalmus maximus TaxID=52904 RepID=A0A6A4RX18_SCOMX|nr:hypothetical protein F2P81_024251 [Scophthalmus maximus]